MKSAYLYITLRIVSFSIAGLFFVQTSAYATLFTSQLDNAFARYYDFAIDGGNGTYNSADSDTLAVTSISAPNGAGSASASAGGTAVGAYATDNSLLGYYPTDSRGTAMIRDLMISGPTTPGGTIPVSFNFALDGFLTDSIVQMNPGISSSVTSTARVGINVSVLNQIPGVLIGGQISGAAGGVEFSQNWQFVGGALRQTEGLDYALGMLLDSTWLTTGDTRHIVGLVSTGPMNVPVNVPFEMQISLDVAAQAYGGGDIWVADATADFAHAFGLPINTPILDLPDGYDFNSVSANIVNNCIGSCTGSSPVPEPATYALMLAALVPMGIVTRRKRVPKQAKPGDDRTAAFTCR